MIVQLDRVDGVEGMLFHHFFISPPTFYKFPALIIYPEGIHEELVDLADPLFCRLLVKSTARFEGGLFVDQGDELGLTSDRLRQDRISPPHASGLVGIAAPGHDLPVFFSPASPRLRWTARTRSC